MSKSVTTTDAFEDPAVNTPQETDLPEALRPPAKAKSVGWRFLQAMANLVFMMAIITSFGILVPNQIATLDPVHKATVLLVIILVGGIPALLGNLVGGALSDRTTSRFGRRRPWILAGGLFSALALVLLAVAPSILVVALAVMLLQVATQAGFACLLAIVPDQVPVTQRATVGGFVSFGLPVGATLGIGVIVQIFHGSSQVYYVLAAALVIALVIFVLLVRDPVLPKEHVPPFHLPTFLASFVRPLKVRDFSLVLFGRVLVMFGYYIVVNYLLYYLEDAVHSTEAQATTQVGIYQGILNTVMVASTIVGGIISDRLQLRKPFVILSGIVMALSLAVLALFPVLPMVLVSSVLLGMGFGVFLSGDLALQSQVLPVRKDTAKDLGILNVGSLLPQLLVPIVVSITITLLNSYPITFFMSAVLVLIGALLIIPIKLVR